MAKALTFDPRDHAPTGEQRVAASTAESAEAIEEALHLLRELSDHRVLSTLTRVVQGADGIGLHVLEAMNEPGSVRAIRNLLELTKALGGVDPEDLSVVGGALGQGLKQGAQSVREGRKAGVKDLLTLSRDPDVGVALGALTAILKGFGQGLREGAGSSKH